jgi:hypothetical protein
MGGTQTPSFVVEFVLLHRASASASARSNLSVSYFNIEALQVPLHIVVEVCIDANVLWSMIITLLSLFVK